MDRLARLSSRVVVDVVEAVQVEAVSPQLGGGDGGGFWGPFCEEDPFEEQRRRPWDDDDELFLRLFLREPPPEPPDATEEIGTLIPVEMAKIKFLKRIEFVRFFFLLMEYK